MSKKKKKKLAINDEVSVAEIQTTVDMLSDNWQNYVVSNGVIHTHKKLRKKAKKVTKLITGLYQDIAEETGEVHSIGLDQLS